MHLGWDGTVWTAKDSGISGHYIGVRTIAWDSPGSGLRSIETLTVHGFPKIPTERSLPVFYRMKPENISCEASVFPTENRGIFLNSTSEDILKDCVIVDKFGTNELFVCPT